MPRWLVRPSAQRAFKAQIVTTADVDAIHSARHHIKAGRKNNGIQWEFRVAYNEALFGKSMNGRSSKSTSSTLDRLNASR